MILYEYSLNFNKGGFFIYYEMDIGIMGDYTIQIQQIEIIGYSRQSIISRQQMGSSQSIPNAQFVMDYLKTDDDRFTVDIDPSKSINIIYKQLLNWSLLEIRNLFLAYRLQYIESKVKTVFLLKRQFTTLFQNFSYQNSGYLFEHLTRTQQFSEIINFFEFMCILILNGHMNYKDKITFLYVVFDFDMSDNLSLDEVVAIFLCVIQGYCKITDQAIPPYQQVEKYAKYTLLKNDQNNDAFLNLKEVLDWVKYNHQCLTFLQRFEPHVQIHNDFQLLLPFKKITPIDCRLLIQQIKNSFNITYQQMKVIGLDLKARQTNRFSVYQMDSQTSSTIKQFRHAQNKKDTKLGELKLDFKGRTPRKFETILNYEQLKQTENATNEQMNDYFIARKTDNGLTEYLDKMIQQREYVFVDKDYQQKQAVTNKKNKMKKDIMKLKFLGKMNTKFKQDDQYIKRQTQGNESLACTQITTTKQNINNVNKNNCRVNLKNSYTEMGQISIRSIMKGKNDEKNPTRGDKKYITTVDQPRINQIRFKTIDQSQELKPKDKQFHVAKCFTYTANKEQTTDFSENNESKFVQYKTDINFMRKDKTMLNNTIKLQACSSVQTLDSNQINELGNLKMRKKKSKALNNTIQLSKQKGQDGSMNKNTSTLKTSNILIMDGKSMTKDQAYNLKHYFDSLSKDKPQVKKEQFTQSFIDKPFVYTQSQSLFFFLDKKKKGFISFDDVMQCFFPNINENQKKTLKKWLASMDYQKNREKMNLGKSDYLEADKIKKKVLPYYCLSRLVELFDKIDEDNKGYITFREFKNHMKGGLSITQIEKAFNHANQNKDGKLKLIEFAQMIIPSDYVIREVDQLYKLNQQKKQYL